MTAGKGRLTRHSSHEKRLQRSCPVTIEKDFESEKKDTQKNKKKTLSLLNSKGVNIFIPPESPAYTPYEE